MLMHNVLVSPDVGRSKNDMATACLFQDADGVDVKDCCMQRGGFMKHDTVTAWVSPEYLALQK